MRVQHVRQRPKKSGRRPACNNWVETGAPEMRGTTRGEAKGGKRACSGSRGGEPRRNAARMQLAYCGCAVLRASGDLQLSIGCTPPQAPAYVL
jgi:hypothetical protein